MRNALFFLFAIACLSCGSSSNFFDTGNATINSHVETIPIKFIYDLPLCTVQINGKDYVFLFDTGAPTVISDEIYNSLNLTDSHSATVVDSQNAERKQKFATLPELRMGNLVFHNIGSVVMTFEAELKCLGIDGIIGANMMAKAFFRLDYGNKLVSVSKDLSAFQLEQSDFVLEFVPKQSKTPIVQGKILGKDIAFTFDTGFTGNIMVENDYAYYKTKTSGTNFITNSGVNSIGAYGANEYAKTFELKDKLILGHISFENETVDSGASNLIGNEFLKDFVFVLDWQKNKIYFKRVVPQRAKGINGFGFSYLFIDGKAIVSSKVEYPGNPINLGDEVISIDGTIFTGLTEAENCKYFLDRVEKGKSEIDIVLKRKDQTLVFHLKRTVFIE